MKKVAIFLEINDYKLEKNGIFNNNILSLNDEDAQKTEIIYDWNNDQLIRDNDEITIKFNFNESKVFYTLKSINSSMQQEIEVLSFQKENNNIKIVYKLEQEQFSFTLSYKEVVL